MERFYLYLGQNPIPLVILLVLVVGGIVVVLFQTTRITTKDVPPPVKREWTNDDWLRSRYSGADCVKDPFCRQLKRIFEDGGASRQAVLNNMTAVNKSLTFAQIQDDAASYEGTPWAFEGKIYDILAAESRAIGKNFLAEISVGGDPAKIVTVKGDFEITFGENEEVYVVGYLTGTSGPRLGPMGLKHPGKIVGMSARALRRPNEPL
jgi:hypothetical protein